MAKPKMTSVRTGRGVFFATWGFSSVLCLGGSGLSRTIGGAPVGACLGAVSGPVSVSVAVLPSSSETRRTTTWRATVSTVPGATSISTRPSFNARTVPKIPAESTTSWPTSSSFCSCSTRFCWLRAGRMTIAQKRSIAAMITSNCA